MSSEAAPTGPRRYCISTGILHNWGACSDRRDAAILFEEEAIPVSPRAYRRLLEHRFSPRTWLGFLVARKDRWDHFRALALAELAEEERHLDGDGPTRAAREEYLRFARHVLADMRIATDAAAHVSSLIEYHQTVAASTPLQSGCWALDLILRTMDAVDPETTDVFAGNGEDEDD